MTSSDPASLDGLDALADVPRLALDEDGLDRLELALGGALPVDEVLPGVGEGRELVLTDAENTPLGHIAVVSRGATLSALRPLAHGGGPHWNPDLRRPASTVRADLAATGGRVLGLVIDVPPALDDEAPVRAAIAAAQAVAVLCVVPVARRHTEPGRVSWAGLTRAGVELAATFWHGTRTDGSCRSSCRGRTRAGASPAHRACPTCSPHTARPRRVLLSDLRSPAVAARLAGISAAIEREVRASYPPASAEAVLRAAEATTATGAVVFFTGLSGSGKSTIARALADEIADVDGRRVTLLDGDEVRQVLSAGLGFDAASRATNIERIAYVAALVAEHGGIAIAAPIAPFAAGRQHARELAERHGAVPARPRQHAAGGLRGARSEGPVRAGAGR